MLEVPYFLAEAAVDTAESENPANMEMRAYTPSVARDSVFRMHVALKHSKRWRGGRVLRVRFFNGDPVLRARVLAAAREWTRHANLVLVESADVRAEIRVRFTSDNASWSVLGTDARLMSAREHTMQFGWLTPASSDLEVREVVLHEFGHALGLIHEHQSPAAAIPWDTAAVYAYYLRVYQWERAKVDAQVFRRYSKKESQYTAFDTASIMLYAIPNELTIGDYEVGWNSDLSPTDRAFARRVYP